MEGLRAEVRPLHGLSDQHLMGGTSVETKEKPTVQPGLSPEGGQPRALPGGWFLCLPGMGRARAAGGSSAAFPGLRLGRGHGVG